MNTKTLKPLHRVLMIAMAVAVALCFIPLQRTANHAYAAEGTWTWVIEGVTVSYTGDGSELEDCDSDGYDDHTGVPVPWPLFDGTHYDRIPDGWDGVTRDYEFYFPNTSNPPGGGGSGGGSNPSGDKDTTTGGGSTNTDTGVKTDKDTVLVKAFDKTPKPKITGKAKVGKTLKAKVGTWNPKPNFTYQWYANGKAIKSAKKATLKLKKAQKGKKITVKVTAKKIGFITAAKTSKKTAKVK